jgi:hypothetical protein
MPRQRLKPTPEPAISDIRRKGWRRQPAANRWASSEIATFTNWCEQHGLHYSATIIRELAMQHGAVKTEATLRRALQIIRGRR